MEISTFINWMTNNTKLSEASIKKYAGAVKTTSKEMIEYNVIYKPLLEMNIFELDLAISKIISNPDFIKKNTVGNKMYSNSLKQLRCFNIEYIENENAYDKLIQVINESGISSTEKEIIISARIGQGLFRQNLMNKYNNKCIVTGIDIKRLLIASHIKPWAICPNNERIDPENGFLLL